MVSHFHLIQLHRLLLDSAKNVAQRGGAVSAYSGPWSFSLNPESTNNSRPKPATSMFAHLVVFSKEYSTLSKSPTQRDIRGLFYSASGTGGCMHAVLQDVALDWFWVREEGVEEKKM